MAGKTNLSATLFSQKKLLGKSSTGTHRADSNEPIPSGVQVAASTIFSEDIPSSPHSTLYQVQSASLNGASTVEYVEFVVEPVTGSTYDANSFDGDASSQASGIHAYRLVLTGTYNSDSNNPKAGSFPFRSDQILHWTLGGLQLVGPQFSNDVPNPYNLTVYSGSRDVDDQIPLLDEIDWQIDYYSGILFVQDFDANKIPTRAKGYIYVGNMLSASLGHASGSNSGGGGGSGGGKDVGWFQSGNSAISTTGSLYIGTSTTSNPEIFFSSVGAATFNEQGRDVDFRIETSNKTHAFTVDGGTNQVLILSGGSGRSFNEPGANDVNFYVSGSVDSRGTAVRGTSVFGGDVVVSGTLYDGSGNQIAGGGSGTVTSGTFLEPASGHLVQTGSVSLAGAEGFSHKTTDVGLDTFFFVSGTVDSRDTTTAGTAVFGGDVVLSGTLSVNRAQAGVGSFVTITSDGKVGIGSDTPAYKLSVGGNMEVGEFIYHKNDADTFIQFADDAIGISAGGEQLITISEAGQDIVKIGDGGDVDFQVRTLGDDNTLYVEGSSDRVGVGTNAPDHKLDVAGDIGMDEYIYHNGDDNTFVRFQEDQIHIKAGGRSMIKMKEDTSDQVLILSGAGGATSPDPAGFADTNFFVSGSTDSRGTAIPGTSVFGGDMVVSGTSHMGGMMPLQDNTYDLGSPSLRFANIYTGDLHLRNERGHWQLIEEKDFLTVTNKLTGKRYKIVLEPYEDDTSQDS